MRTADRTTTLGELRGRLPLGVLEGGQLLRDIELVEYRFKQEKEIAALVKERNVRSMGAYLNAVLSVLLERVGPHRLSSMKMPERQIVINQMFAGDVLYAYCWARVQALGETLAFPQFHCPSCRHELDEIHGDLRTLEVRTAEKPEQLEQPLELRDGILLEKQVRKNLRVRAPRWEVFDLPEDPSSTAELGEITLRCCVVGAEGIEADRAIYLDDAALESLSKYDYQKLLRAADQLSGGPVMGISGQCPKCRRNWSKRLEWDFESFFGTSSR